MKNSGFHLHKLSWQPGGSEKKILRELNLSLPPGKFYVLLGPNGAGKSSLLRILMGFIRASEGELFFDGRPLAAIRRRELAKKVAYLPQRSESLLELPTREIIAMGRYPWMRRFADPSAEDRAAIERAIRLCACGDLLDKNFAFLSGGERQRVLSCRCLAQDTEWILMDEPAANLDPRFQLEILQTLKELRAQGKSIISVLHDVNLAWRYAEHLLLMKEGRIVCEGDRNAVMREEILSEVYGLTLRAYQISSNKCFFQAELAL